MAGSNNFKDLITKVPSKGAGKKAVKSMKKHHKRSGRK